LVIEVSIVRPGPITGGMVHPYLRRRNGEEEVVYPHPSLEPVLKKTLGVPLFQEQVMKLAVVAADYTPGEADQLRRDMAAWRRTGRLERHRERLITRMVAKGITMEFAERVFEQIKGFGDYGFPESHAASFAYIGYVSAWLKCHYPAVFTCALLNAQPMGFYTPASLIDDAKRHGVTVRAVDVQHSDWDSTMEPTQGPVQPASAGLPNNNYYKGEEGKARFECDRKFAVRVGLRYVKGLREDEGAKILAARACGPFESIDDFVRRTGCEDGALTRLAEAGAFESLDPQRRNALWKTAGAASERDREREHPDQETLPFGDNEADVPFDDLEEYETIAWDYGSTGHSTHGHLLTPVRHELRAMGLPDAKTVWKMRSGRRVRYAGIVINRQRPSTAKGVVFITLEDETGFVNVIVWRDVFKKFEILGKTASFLGVTGKLQSEEGVAHLIAESLWDPATARRPKRRGSRDFH
jgi:error-prone DNA polymerase